VNWYVKEDLTIRLVQPPFLVIIISIISRLYGRNTSTSTIFFLGRTLEQ
jgi:hypothetical protein